MKKVSRVLSVVLCLVFALSCMMTFVAAAETATATKDGITATLTTSKDSYTNEDVDVKLTLKNETDHAIANITAKVTGLEALQVKSGKTTATGLLLAKSGELVANDLVFSKEAGTGGDSGNGSGNPATGNNDMMLWTVIMSISGIALLVVLMLNKHNRTVCAVLAVLLVAGVALPAQASAAGEALEVTKAITVNGEAVTLKATVEVVDYVAHCAHCDKDVTWTPWTSTTNLPADDQENGHYYLAVDVEIPNVQRQLRGNKDIVLNLNGHKVYNFPGVRVYGMSGDNNHLSILDTSEGAKGQIIIEGTFTKTPGALCYFGGTNSTLNLYSGTVDANAAKGDNAGVVLRVRGSNNVFNMHGGTIIGGTVTDAATPETYGGAISLNGVMNMYGGTVKGGRVQSNAANGSSAGIGGNICIRNNAKLVMTGGTIEGGQSNIGGSNVDVQPGGTFEFSGGTIKGGTNTNAGAEGGNVFCQPAPADGSKAAGKLEWTGNGTIEGMTKP